MRGGRESGNCSRPCRLYDAHSPAVKALRSAGHPQTVEVIACALDVLQSELYIHRWGWRSCYHGARLRGQFAAVRRDDSPDSAVQVPVLLFSVFHGTTPAAQTLLQRSDEDLAQAAQAALWSG
jgi:hypothetical protein